MTLSYAEISRFALKSDLRNIEGDFRRKSSCEIKKAGTDFFGSRPVDERPREDSNLRPLA